MTRPAHVVRDLWSAHESKRLEALLDAAGDEIVWQPNLIGGKTFRSTAELRRALEDLLASGVDFAPRLEALEDHEGVIVASGTLRTTRDGAADERLIHSTYHFRDGRLARQASHASRQDALDSIVAVRVATSLGTDEEAGADGERIVRLRGELDIANAAELEALLVRARPRGQRVVLDLAELRFMDSTGLRALLSGRTAAREGGWELTLDNVHRNVARLFELAGVHDLLGLDPPPD